MILRRCLLALIVLWSATALPAQITFTITAEARAKPEGGSWASTYGYTQGQSYTFVFTTGTSFANNSSSVFSSAYLAWVATSAGEGNIWASVSGSGLGGAYVAPTGADINSQLSYARHNTGRDILSLTAATDDPTGLTSPYIGLTTPNNTAIAELRMEVSNKIGSPLTPVTSFPALSYLSAFEDPVSYFSTRTGTYTGSWTFTQSGGAPLDNTVGIYLRVPGPGVDFTAKYELAVTSITISAVPEPSTYAVLAGGAGLAIAVWRRRRVYTERH